MRVTNATKAVINYKGMAYAPGKSFDVDAEHEKQMEGMLADGRLTVDLGDQKDEKKSAAKK